MFQLFRSINFKIFKKVVFNYGYYSVFKNVTFYIFSCQDYVTSHLRHTKIVLDLMFEVLERISFSNVHDHLHTTKLKDIFISSLTSAENCREKNAYTSFCYA